MCYKQVNLEKLLKTLVLSLILSSNLVYARDFYLILLRQPRAKSTGDMRRDPFWKFGSFGLTGCHNKNLLHPKNIELLRGQSVGFVQGGKDGFKLVNLIHDIIPSPHNSKCEINWKNKEMPFKYENAPKIIDNLGNSDFPQIKSFIKEVNRNTWMGKFGSKFRTYSKKLPEKISNEFFKVFQSSLRESSPDDFAKFYYEAINRTPPVIDKNREASYRQLLEEAKCTSLLK